MRVEQIELTEEQAQKLEEIAKQERIAVADVVSRAVNEMLDARDRKRAELWERSLEVMGKFDSGLPDLAERHDDYLDQDYDR